MNKNFDFKSIGLAGILGGIVAFIMPYIFKGIFWMFASALIVIKWLSLKFVCFVKNAIKFSKKEETEDKKISEIIDITE